MSNANYLWIQYFHAYLNETGRAGFVMAASATDAGHGERDIRREIVETRDVDAIIRIGEKFFYTRTLPCTLWFFDRAKPAARRDQVLMIDARAIHRVVSRRVHDFSEEQLANLTAIVWLHRGERERYLGLVRRYLERTRAAAEAAPAALAALDAPLAALGTALTGWQDALRKRTGVDPTALAALAAAIEERTAVLGALEAGRTEVRTALRRWTERQGPKPPGDNDGQKDAYTRLSETLPRLKALQKHVTEVHKLTERALDVAEKQLGGRGDDAWDNRVARTQRQALEDARHGATEALRQVGYLAQQVHWLQSRFPDAAFVPVAGLCRAVTREEVAAQDWSLTPGRYVGVAAPEGDEDDDDVVARLREIHLELQGLHEEAAEVAKTIAANFEELAG